MNVILVDRFLARIINLSLFLTPLGKAGRGSSLAYISALYIFLNACDTLRFYCYFLSICDYIDDFSNALCSPYLWVLVLPFRLHFTCVLHAKNIYNERKFYFSTTSSKECMLDRMLTN